MIGDGMKLDEDDVPTFDIPIFTEEFLDHNKSMSSYLKQILTSINKSMDNMPLQ